MKRKNPVDSNDEDQLPKKKTTQHLTFANVLSIDTTPSESLPDPTIGADVKKLVAGLAELGTRVRSLEKSCEGGFKELTLWVRVVAKELLEMREEQKRTPVEAPMDSDLSGTVVKEFEETWSEGVQGGCGDRCRS